MWNLRSSLYFLNLKIKKLKIEFSDNVSTFSEKKLLKFGSNLSLKPYRGREWGSDLQNNVKIESSDLENPCIKYHDVQKWSRFDPSPLRYVSWDRIQETIPKSDSATLKTYKSSTVSWKLVTYFLKFFLVPSWSTLSTIVMVPYLILKKCLATQIDCACTLFIDILSFWLLSYPLRFTAQKLCDVEKMSDSLRSSVKSNFHPFLSTTFQG